MTPADLDALAALVGQLQDDGPYFAEFFDGVPVIQRDDGNNADALELERIVALVNAAPDLLRLARLGLQHEATFRYGYRLGASRVSNEETEDDVVRLWQHKEAMEAEI